MIIDGVKLLMYQVVTTPRLSPSAARQHGGRLPDGSHVRQRSTRCLLQVQGTDLMETRCLKQQADMAI